MFISMMTESSQHKPISGNPGTLPKFQEYLNKGCDSRKDSHGRLSQAKFNEIVEYLTTNTTMISTGSTTRKKGTHGM